MKFSVLLPTRNGGRFLKDCIESILAEPYDDMELIVSDNANTDETQDVIKSFAHDKRLKAVRLEKAVPVTDNWNNALRASSGDYILMMGDDDCLLPGYFKRMDELLEKYGMPDCVTYNAYTFVAPGSINSNEQSYYSRAHFKFGGDFKKEDTISPEARFSIVRDMFRFRVRIPLNMQTTIMSRKAIDNIKGGIFRPPFPDHYALNALLLNAAKWVYLPENMLVVGVSPKSFGHFVYSNRQDKGLNYLGIGSDFPGRLPGNELINHMYVWLELLKNDYQDELKNIRISRPDYARRQAYHWYMQYRLKTISFGELVNMARMLSPGDWMGILVSFADGESWKRLFRMAGSKKNNDTQKIWRGLSALDGVSSIGEFKRWAVKDRASNAGVHGS